MRLDDMRESDNVEDRRGFGGRRLALGGVGTLIVIVIGLITGVDPMALLNMGGASLNGGAANAPVNARQDESRRKLVSRIFASTEDVWPALLAKSGKRYATPTLVLFRGEVDSACGLAGAAVGPFYCPGDSKVYIDLSFFDELERRFKAPGDFAQAYVIAHEVGHHVQNLLGVSERVHAMRRQLSEKDYNALSVRMELQADFYAGVWAHHAEKARHILEVGDLEEGLRAATAIGDDAIQKQATGHVVPDAFTHGTSEQRLRWFRKGFDTGDMSQGDTFGATRL